jgi:hypothetical protein
MAKNGKLEEVQGKISENVTFTELNSIKFVKKKEMDELFCPLRGKHTSIRFIIT